jgi:hypothetical protein
VGFRIIKKPHADNIFLTTIPDEQKDVLGNRLSQQQLTQKIHRRLFGASTYFSNPSAGTDEIDDVTMVTDPEVYLPVNSADRLLFSVDVPDFVASAVMSLKADGDVVQYHSLRFLPKIQFVKLSELPDIYSQIVQRAASLPGDGIAYPQLQDDLAKIKKIIDNAK